MIQSLPQRQPPESGDTVWPDVPDWTPPSRRWPDRERRDVAGMLRRNVWLIIAAVVIAVAAAAVMTYRQAPTFEASASLRIDERGFGIPALDMLQNLTRSEVSTEREMLASRTNAEEVADSLALQVRVLRPAGVSRGDLVADARAARDASYAFYRVQRMPDERFSIQDSSGTTLAVAAPGGEVALPGVRFTLAPAAARHALIELDVLPFDDAVTILRSGLSVDRPSRDVSIVVVSYRSSDPALARDVPNAIVSRFIARRQEAKQGATRSTVTFLREQLAKLSVQLRSAEDALRSFREREGVVSLPEQASTQISRVAELQAQRAALETERSALARPVMQARRSAARPGDSASFRDVLAFPTLLKSQVASELLGSLSNVEDRRTELLARRSPQDPDVQVLTTRAAQLEDQLRRIGETYLQALSDQIASVDAALQQSERRLETIPVQEARLARLQRDAKGYEEIYTLLQSRLKEAEIAAAADDSSARVVDRALLPRYPVAPRPAVNLSVALVVGLLLGISAAFAREFTDRAVHTRGDLHGITNRPVLGLVPAIRSRGWLSPRVGSATRSLMPGPLRRLTSGSANIATPSHGDGRSAAREAFNGLQAKVAFALSSDAPRTLVVTSPLPGDGKTTVAVNLAGTIARQGKKVLLIDADLRRGIVHSVFHLPRSPGLADVLAGAIGVGGALRMVEVAHGRVLHVLVGGTPSEDPTQVLGRTQASAFMTRMATEFDWVIVDSPPLNVVADATLLGATGSGVLLVARAGVTSGDALAYATEQLRGVGANVVGTILNAIDKREASYDATTYSYYEYATASEPAMGRARAW